MNTNLKLYSCQVAVFCLKDNKSTVAVVVELPQRREDDLRCSRVARGRRTS